MPCEFRPLKRDDLPLVGCWLAQPAVRRWWGNPPQQLHKISLHLAAPGVSPYLAIFAARPFGYIQCYDPGLDPDATLPPQPADTRGIDFFIGEPAMRGRGHGTRLIRRFTDSLLRGARVSRVIADPDPRNLASCEALASAGFRDEGPLALPWGEVRLMVKEEILAVKSD